MAKRAKPNGQAAGKHQERAVALTVGTEAARPRQEKLCSVLFVALSPLPPCMEEATSHWMRSAS